MAAFKLVSYELWHLSRTHAVVFLTPHGGNICTRSQWLFGREGNIRKSATSWRAKPILADTNIACPRSDSLLWPLIAKRPIFSAQMFSIRRGS